MSPVKEPKLGPDPRASEIAALTEIKRINTDLAETVQEKKNGCLTSEHVCRIKQILIDVETAESLRAGK